MKRISASCIFIFLMLLGNAAWTLADEDVTITLSYEKNYAYIGQPFTVSYEICGGSGEYSDIFLSSLGVTEMCGTDYYQLELFQSSGVCTITPTSGDYLEIDIGCTDVKTNKRWYSEKAESIQCFQNPDIDVSFIDLPDAITLSNPFSVQYSIDCQHEIDEATMSFWVFSEDDAYPDCLYEEEFTTKSGCIPYTPILGRELFVSIQGTDTSGQPFYARTKRIALEGLIPYEPISAKFGYQNSTAQIGSPFTISYDIHGGSGQYKDIYISSSAVTEMCAIDYCSEEITEASGSYTIVPTCGAEIDFTISLRDAVTNKRWEFYSERIKCVQNPHAVVRFVDLPKQSELDEVFNVQYSIGTSFPIEDASVSWWVFVDDDTYPDKLYEQKLSAANGIIGYSPRIGHALYIAIQGKDAQGNPFYAKTERIPIVESPSIENCIFLPISLRRIESKAFAAVPATKVYIPVSVSYIADDAFEDSSVTTILGSNEYAEAYANKHNMQFIYYAR